MDEEDASMDGVRGRLRDYFSSLDDPRIERNKGDLLQDIIVIAICGVICGPTTGLRWRILGAPSSAGCSNF